MTRQHTLANGATEIEYSRQETAQLVKAALRGAFPGVRFSVRSSSSGGYASVSVRWVADASGEPSEQAVEAVCAAYRGMEPGTLDAPARVRRIPGENGVVIRYAVDTILCEQQGMARTPTAPEPPTRSHLRLVAPEPPDVSADAPDAPMSACLSVPDEVIAPRDEPTPEPPAQPSQESAGSAAAWLAEVARVEVVVTLRSGATLRFNVAGGALVGMAQSSLSLPWPLPGQPVVSEP